MALNYDRIGDDVKAAFLAAQGQGLAAQPTTKVMLLRLVVPRAVAERLHEAVVKDGLACVKGFPGEFSLTLCDPAARGQGGMFRVVQNPEASATMTQVLKGRGWLEVVSPRSRLLALQPPEMEAR
jgi:hypothetical protein